MRSTFPLIAFTAEELGQYPVLRKLCGNTNNEASAVFIRAFLDRIEEYPTTIFGRALSPSEMTTCLNIFFWLGTSQGLASLSVQPVTPPPHRKHRKAVTALFCWLNGEGHLFLEDILRAIKEKVWL